MARVNSTQQVAVQQATLQSPQKALQIDAGQFRFDDSEARAMQQFGGVIQELGVRKLEAIDALAISKAAQLRQEAGVEMQAYMATHPDAETWSPEQSKIFNKYVEETNKLKMSGKARQRIENENETFGNISKMDTEIKSTTALIDTDIAVKSSQLISIHANGNDSPESLSAMDQSLADYEEALLRKYTEEEAAVMLSKTLEQAQAERKQVANNNVRNFAVANPQVAIEQIDAELKARKDGEVTAFPDVENEELNSAKQLAKSTIVEQKNMSQEQYDVAVGEASAVISEGLKPGGTMTGNDVRNMDIQVPADKQEDLLIFKNKWAGIFDADAERTRKIQDGKDKKAREDAYSPEIVAEFKNEAKRASTPQQVADIKQRAAQALTENIINDEDLEQINTSADGVFTTAVDAKVDEMDGQFRRTITKGFQDASLPLFLQSELEARQTIGVPVTVDDISELRDTFHLIQRAQEWASNNVKRQVEDEVQQRKDDDKPMTVNEVRELYLQQQKQWFNKNAVELSKDYKTWLTSKP